jgi:DNA repair photolyase
MPASPHNPSLKGRGASANPGNRFERAHYAPDPDPQSPAPDEPSPNQNSKINIQKSLPLTQYLPDASKSIIASNTSPDVPFTHSINPYRGCSHGCIYCFARPTHEYLGLSAGLDFETKILVKHDATDLLRRELSAKKWQPQVIALSGVTDCYQPAEREFRLTRRCLEVLLDFRNPVGIVTKNHLITRDLDLLTQLAVFNCVQVFVSVTTLDPHLTQIMEPRTSVPRDRLRTIRELAAAGIPVGVMVAPVIPALTDHEMPGILEAARDAGAVSAGFVPLRLPFGLKDLFETWLRQYFPDRAPKILNRTRELHSGTRDGALYNPNPFDRMRGTGPWSNHLAQTFKLHTARLGLNERRYTTTTEHFRVPPPPPKAGDQLGLFTA